VLSYIAPEIELMLWKSRKHLSLCSVLEVMLLFTSSTSGRQFMATLTNFSSTPAMLTNTRVS